MSAAAWQCPPLAELAGIVDAFWSHALPRSSTGGSAIVPIEVFPDGCIDLIFARSGAADGVAGDGALFVAGAAPATPT